MKREEDSGGTEEKKREKNQDEYCEKIEGMREWSFDKEE